MSENKIDYCIAFLDDQKIASGNKLEVATRIKNSGADHKEGNILIFDYNSSEVIEIDMRGSLDEITERLKHEMPVPRGPGRPKLGVIGREVTLLPRHWEWLNSQPGGASVALRKLVEKAKRENEVEDIKRKVLESAYRFMSAIAGNLPGYEEAIRALYAEDDKKFRSEISKWPEDIKNHCLYLKQRGNDN